MTARPTHPDQPLPQLIRASSIAVRKQALDLSEAVTDYASDPRPGSPAVRERAALAKNTTAVAAQVKFYTLALHQARVRVAAVYDHVVSVGRLLGGDGRVSLFSHTSLSRDACEAAVRVHWLLDPGIGGQERIVRSAVSWYSGMQDQLRGAKALPTGHLACTPESLQQLRDYLTKYLELATTAGMSMPRDSKGKHIAAFELGTVRVPVKFNVSEAMGAALPEVPSWYAISSAASHGSPWILMDAVTSDVTDDFLRMSPNLMEVGASALSAIAASALIIKTYAEFYGHDPQTRLTKVNTRRGIVDRLMQEEIGARAATGR